MAAVPRHGYVNLVLCCWLRREAQAIFRLLLPAEEKKKKGKKEEGSLKPAVKS